jgi:hypothetical protein
MIALTTFATAGNATFTVTSRKTGNRFTYKVRKPNPDGPAFVALLSGPDNESDYQFLGTIFPDGTYRHGRKSRISSTAPSAIAFDWVWKHATNLPEAVEVHHEGKCCRCGRKLTVPESIESGIGPECATKM